MTAPRTLPAMPGRPDWRPPTIHEARVAAHAARMARRGGDTSADTPAAEVAPSIRDRAICPGLPDRRCGRRIPTRHLRDVSGVPEAVVGRAAREQGLCDACEQIVLQQGRMTPAAWWVARGAPPTVVQALVAKAQWQAAQRAIPVPAPSGIVSP